MSSEIKRIEPVIRAKKDGIRYQDLGDSFYEKSVEFLKVNFIQILDFF